MTKDDSNHNKLALVLASVGIIIPILLWAIDKHHTTDITGNIEMSVDGTTDLFKTNKGRLTIRNNGNSSLLVNHISAISSYMKKGTFSSNSDLSSYCDGYSGPQPFYSNPGITIDRKKFKQIGINIYNDFIKGQEEYLREGSLDNIETVSVYVGTKKIKLTDFMENFEGVLCINITSQDIEGEKYCISSGFFYERPGSNEFDFTKSSVCKT